MKINYVIGTWSGIRTNTDVDGERWRCYVKYHLEHLNTIKHSLSQVTIGFPRNPDKVAHFEYEKYLKGLRKLECGTSIQILPVGNIGRSYGQYSSAFEKYGEAFSHYIFIEDDYIPTMDDFDTELIEILQQMGCGYLCSVAQTVANGPEHAAVSNGVVTCKTLRKVWDKYGNIPHGHKNMNGQRTFSLGFIGAGCVIDDYLHKYSCTYMNHGKDGHSSRYRIYGDPSKPSIISPIQTLWDKEAPLDRELMGKNFW